MDGYCRLESLDTHGQWRVVQVEKNEKKRFTVSFVLNSVSRKEYSRFNTAYRAGNFRVPDLVHDVELL
jgi:hypothetical protein